MRKANEKWKHGKQLVKYSNEKESLPYSKQKEIFLIEEWKKYEI